MNIPDVTVLLPFYNAEKTLSRAIKSILQQTYSNFELLLINNNSEDQGVMIAEEYSKRDRRCLVIHEKKRGIVHALNRGLEVAAGKYIARMDADDWSFPDRLERQVRFLNENPSCGLVAGKAEYVSPNPITEGFARYVAWSNSISDSIVIHLRQFMESPIIHPTVTWRREVSDRFGTYRQGAFPEDYELWLRWMSEGVKFEKLNITLIKWHDSENRLTRKDKRYSDEAFFKIKTSYLVQWLKLHNPFHPDVVIWGASKISRKRAKLLNDHEIEITAFIDITEKRQLGRQIIYYKDIPSPKEIFVLVYLKEENMRQKTIQFLSDRNFIEGENYLLVS